MLEGVLLCVTRMVVACGILSSLGRQITVYSPQRGNTQDRTDHSKGMRVSMARDGSVTRKPTGAVPEHGQPGRRQAVTQQDYRLWH